MRNVITICSCLVGLAIFILINNVLISVNMRNSEVNKGIRNAVDYAVDIMTDVYASLDYDSCREDEYTTQLMEEFCKALNEKITTDGEINVSLMHVDMQQGIMDIRVIEDFEYHILGKKGQAFCERTIVFT